MKSKNIMNSKLKLEKELKPFPKKLWAVIAALALLNKRSLSSIEIFVESESFLDLLKKNSIKSKSEISRLIQLSSEINIIDIKQLESVLEKSLDVETKKIQGVVYTPDFIIDYILENTLTGVKLVTQKNPLLDPACGSGGFLVRAAALLSEKLNLDFSQSTALVTGLDINPDAVQNARILLDVASLIESGKLSRAKIEICDTLLVPIEQQFNLLGISGVSALVTNPPYVKLQNLDNDYASKLLKLYPSIASGSFTLASLFLHNAPKYLTSQGHAGFITLNNIFTSLSGKNLRDEWSLNLNVRKIIDFRHFTIFDASAYTCLIFLGREKYDHIEFNAVSEMPNADSLRKIQPFLIPYNLLKANKWRLGDESALKLISSMENNGNALNEIADIKVGFATLKDRVFTGEFKNGLPRFVGGDGTERIIENKAVRFFYKISEFNSPLINDINKRPIIYPYDDSKTVISLIPLADFKRLYPNAFDHLNSWRKELESRGNTDSKEWHQWGRRQSLRSPGPKLLTKTFDSKPTFRLDDSDALFCNGYSVKPKLILNSYSIEILKEFLESSFVYAYAMITSFEIAGGYQCYQKNFIEKICLPPIEFFDKVKELNQDLNVALSNFYGISLFELRNILKFYSGDKFNDEI